MYQRIVNRVYEDGWVENDDLWPGMKEGNVDFASLSNRVYVNRFSWIISFLKRARLIPGFQLNLFIFIHGKILILLKTSRHFFGTQCKERADKI